MRFLPAKRDQEGIYPEHYEAEIMNEKNETEVVKIDYNWVEEKYSPEALLAVKAVHYNDGFIIAPIPEVGVRKT